MKKIGSKELSEDSSQLLPKSVEKSHFCYHFTVACQWKSNGHIVVNKTKVKRCWGKLMIFSHFYCQKKRIKIKFYNGILLPKLFWPTVRKECSSDWENLLKFEAEGWEFEKFWDH